MAVRLFLRKQQRIQHIVRTVAFSNHIIGSPKTEPQLAASPARIALSSLGKRRPSLPTSREPTLIANSA